MNIQKIFALSFALVGFGLFLQAAEKSSDLTSSACAYSFPKWAADAIVDDSGSVYPSNNRISDGTKRIHADAVDAKRKFAQQARAAALQAAPGIMRKLNIG